MLALATAFAAGGADAAPRPFRPDAAHCPLATATQAAWLPSEWARFARAVRVCRVKQGAGPGGLLVVSVWEEAWYAPLPAGTLQVEMPKPLLMTPGGRALGVLPTNFPDDTPTSLRLRFVGWRDGVPAEIRLCLSTIAVGGDQPLAPLRYDPATRRYERAGADPEASLHDECHVR